MLVACCLTSLVVVVVAFSMPSSLSSYDASFGSYKSGLLILEWGCLSFSSILTQYFVAIKLRVCVVSHINSSE